MKGKRILRSVVRNNDREFPNYEITTDGRVFNRYGNEMYQYTNRNGYSCVRLSHDGGRTAYTVHRLVANTFIPNPENKETINHINGIKTDNRIDNLEWATYGENLKHAYDHGLHESYLTQDDRLKGNHNSAVVRRRPVRVIETGRVYSSLRECSDDTGCSMATISRCCNNKVENTRGYHFEFTDVMEG